MQLPIKCVDTYQVRRHMHDNTWATCARDESHVLLEVNIEATGERDACHMISLRTRTSVIALINCRSYPES